MLIKFLQLSSLQRREIGISQNQHSTRTGQFVMLDLIRWTTMGTVKNKHENTAQGSYKGGRRGRKQPAGELGTEQTHPDSIRDAFKTKYHFIRIHLAETK